MEGTIRTIAILQARIGSTRLPGKVLLPLGGAPMVQRIIERVERATKLDDVVLAIPSSDWTAFQHLQNAVDIYCYPGPENDLVARYVCAADCSRADLIVRIPCDNPCVDPEYIDKCIEKYMAWPTVFETNAGCAEVGSQIVDGIGCEVFSLSRLKWLDENTRGMPAYREHPHLLFHDHIKETAKWSELREVIRLDVNTHADYLFIKDIYDALYPTTPTFGIRDILAYLDAKTVTT